MEKRDDSTPHPPDPRSSGHGLTVAGLVLSVALATTAQAQVRPAIAPHVDVQEPCAVVDLYTPREFKEFGRAWPTAERLTTCIKALKTFVKSVKPAQGKDATVAQQRQLLQAYLTYLNLKRWHRFDACPRKDGVCVTYATPDLRARERNAFNELSEELRTQMTAQGILNPFSAVLVTGFSFTALGAQAAVPADIKVPLKVDVAGLDSQSTQATGFLNWETHHFVAEHQRKMIPDFSVAGAVGFRPTLTLVTLSDSSQQSGTTPPLATFQQAFAWDAGVNMYWSFADVGEGGVYLRYGQTVLTSMTTLLGTGSQAAVGRPIQNMTGRAEGKFDLGYKVNLYADALELVHVVKHSLSPIFLASAGVRQDLRFKGQGDLLHFDKPEWRLYYSVAIDTLQILKPVTHNNKESKFQLNLQVDYERALVRPDSQYVPSATRVFIQGKTDIVQFFQGKEQ